MLKILTDIQINTFQYTQIQRPSPKIFGIEFKIMINNERNNQKQKKSTLGARQMKAKMIIFQRDKQLNKQMCEFIASFILLSSILVLNKLDVFFDQLIQILEQAKIPSHYKLKTYINVDNDLKIVYFAIQNKLLLLKEYPSYQLMKQSLQQNFKKAVKIVNLVKQLAKRKILKQFQIFNGKQILISYKSQKDTLILRYLKFKLDKTQRSAILQQIAKQRPFDPEQYLYKTYLQNIQSCYLQKMAQKEKKTIPLLKLDYDFFQSKSQQSAAKSNCVLCSPFYIYNVDLGAQKISSSDIVVFEGVKKMRESEQNKIKQQVAAFCNSDRSGIIQFDCIQRGLQIIPKGWYMTQKSKESYQQTFCSLLESVQPRLQINKDFKIDFVPIKYYPQNKKQGQFLPGVFVMRIRIAPSRVSQSKLFKCKIDGTYYYYIRQKKKNIRLTSQKSIKEQKQRRQLVYGVNSTLKIRGQRSIPQNLHYGSCNTPQDGKIDYEYNKENFDSFIKLLLSNYQLQSSTANSPTYDSIVLLVADSNWKENFHIQFKQFGINNKIQNYYKDKFEIAKTTLVMKYNKKFENVIQAIDSQAARKMNYFRIGLKKVISIHVSEFLRIRNIEFNQKTLNQIKQELQRYGFTQKDVRVWQDPKNNETFIKSQSKLLLIYLYFKYKEQAKKLKNNSIFSQVNFKNPDQYENLVELKTLEELF